MQTVSRLITYFTPAHYNLSLTLNRKERTFHGTVDIRGVAKIAGEIRFHAKDLVIQSVLIDGKQADHHIDSDELIVHHPDLTPRSHLVTISFSGTITDGMHGLYPCYFEHDGVKKELLATQFESHHAREVFPCIDEPEAKATFDLTLVTEPDVTVLGNMPVKVQHVKEGRLTTIFEKTPRMSTYLLAWVVGELQRKTAKTKDNIEVNIWATPTQPASSLDFALKTAVDTIEFFNDYFDTSYPLPKSDHVALPDFSAGAMENWGLITYREQALLAEPKTTGISAKQYIALVIAHELSHQWFGNLVTMKWWNNLWLNESFATLMEYVAVDALHPEWNIWLDFSTRESTLALRRDSIDGVQPVQTDVRHPDEITTLFDSAIVYAKGARLLRMLYTFISKEAFRKALQLYFKTHAYQNTEADDLWQAFSNASGEDISQFMNAWISQPGYPVVSVTKTADGVQLTQAQFFVGKHQPSERLWPIPLGTTQAEIPKLFRTQKVILRTATVPRLNQGDSAHFITHYEDSAMENFLAELTTFTPIDRLQLLHEQLLLTRNNTVPSARLIKLLFAYKAETSEPVWNMINLAFQELTKFVENDPLAKQQMQSFGTLLARTQYQRLGWQAYSGESEADKKLRATILSLMLYGRDSEAIQTALDNYSQALEEIDAEIRPLVLSAVVRHATDTNLFASFIQKYTKTTSPELRSDLRAGLTSTEKPIEIQQLLDLLKDKNSIRIQDIPQWTLALLANPHSRIDAWSWIRENWSWITATYKGDKSYDTFVRFCGNTLSTHPQLEEFKTFFAPIAKREPALKRIIAIAQGEIEARVEIIEKNTEAVKKALAKFDKST